ncbi:HpcH/HpaI aldolase/citrate lyase family protein [Nocardioides sp. URHA0032]|uniref:HpcH/HpaI aldolase/citrate lyase family protein n=1 Tax=Nocardioides sp. URHA0032 TaxID=1380388 RepID=UPI000490CDC9|nr:HpcH/HpaI aldolase/citrate lyase family protein [Nocardioides sp. URHA0032]
MRHFDHLNPTETERLFSVHPEEFDRDADAEVLAVALGATLYMPATRTTLARDLVKQGGSGVVSSVVCLEDAIADVDLPAAEKNVVNQLGELGRAVIGGGPAAQFPLTFVRVRNPDQIVDVVDGLGVHARVLSGFVLPKFTEETGVEFLEALADVRSRTGLALHAMPVIESPEAVHVETRTDMLLGVQRLLAKHRDVVLAVRLGATDLSAAFGIRRDRDLTIYDVRVVAEVISDVVNVLGRADGSGYVVTGPVWEYFVNHDRMSKPLLRESPFDENDERKLRHRLIRRDLDGLIREAVLDKANGLTGKTVIHPTHVAAVHALSVVTHEEYADACDILGEQMTSGGVRASAYRNKMNEARPHRSWAERTVRRAAAFGVAAPEVGFVDLLAASACT